VLCCIEIEIGIGNLANRTRMTRIWRIVADLAKALGFVLEFGYESDNPYQKKVCGDK